jgi:hypothetical protein
MEKIFTEKEKEKLYNQEMPLICECKDVTFEELLIENPEIYNKEYKHIIPPKELKEKWEQILKKKNNYTPSEWRIYI